MGTCHLSEGCVPECVRACVTVSVHVSVCVCLAQCVMGLCGGVNTVVSCESAVGDGVSTCEHQCVRM